MEYIGGPPQDGCFLCDAATSEDENASLVVMKTDLCVVMMNKYPYNSGHLLVAPLRHVASLAELTSDESADVLRLVTVATATLEAEMKAEGFNIGANLGSVAGAGVPDHIHFHVVPRWAGDTNFMPVLADSKVIPEDLTKTRERLSVSLARFAGKEGLT